MTSKNIAIFIDSLGGGGAEKVMLTLSKGLLEKGHYVHFFLLEPRIEYLPQNLPISVLYDDIPHRESTKCKNLNQTAKDMQLLVDKVSSQVGQFHLHLVNLDPTSQVIHRCEFENVFFILHNAMKQEIKREAKLGPFKLYRKVREKRVYNNKHLIAVSKGVEQEASNSRLVKPASIRTIYNPTDVEQILALQDHVNDQIPLEPYLVHAGRVVKQKRHDVLFKALALVPDIKLVLLCKYVKKARKLAKKYGVDDRVITPGFQENPYPWIKNAKALVSSSDFEGLGMNLIDSLVCGTPVVSTDCDYGPSEIMTGTLSSFLCPVGDHEQLAERIKLVLSKPPIIDPIEVSSRFSLNTSVEGYLSLAK